MGMLYGSKSHSLITASLSMSSALRRVLYSPFAAFDTYTDNGASKARFRPRYR